MAARVKRPVEIGDVDIGELVGRCEVGLRFLVTLETLGRIGLCIGLVGFGIEWRLPAGRARQRDVVAGILEHIIGRGKFLEPEPGLLPGIAKLIVAGENHEDFHARSPFFKRRSPVAVWPGFVSRTRQRQFGFEMQFSVSSEPFARRGLSIKTGRSVRYAAGPRSFYSTGIE